MINPKERTEFLMQAAAAMPDQESLLVWYEGLSEADRVLFAGAVKELRVKFQQIIDWAKEWAAEFAHDMNALYLRLEDAGAFDLVTEKERTDPDRLVEVLNQLINFHIDDVEIVEGLVAIRTILLDGMRDVGFLRLNITEEQWVEAMAIHKSDVDRGKPQAMFIVEGMSVNEFKSVPNGEWVRIARLVTRHPEHFRVDTSAPVPIFTVVRHFLENSLREGAEK